MVDAREKLKMVALLSNHKDGSVAHWFDPYKELMNWVGGGQKETVCGQGEGRRIQPSVWDRLRLSHQREAAQ